MLDQALWSRFKGAASPDEFIDSWLAILCRQLPGNVTGVVLVGDPDAGPYVPIAYWPEKSRVGEQHLIAANKSLAKRQGMAIAAAGGEATAQIVSGPLFVDGKLYGVCSVEVSDPAAVITEVMRKIQWAAGWIEAFFRRRLQEEEQELAERSRLAFDMLSSVLEAEGGVTAATSLATEMATRLKADPVSVGFVKRRKCRVAALSHASGFGNKMNLIRDIGSAMDEAVDQNAVIVYPADETWDYRVSLAHEELARLHRSGSILTVPLQSGGRIIGAMTLQRPASNPFDAATVELCDAVAAVVGPVLEEKRLNDRNIFIKIIEAAADQFRRLFGAGYFGRKLATAIAVVLVAFFSYATTDYSVTSPAIIRGTIQRTIVAPFNGYVANEEARAGELVRQGQELARLDDQDLSFERLRLATTRQQKMTEYDRALTQHERAEALIIKAQVEQTDAQLALIDEQLRRTRLVAPFDGYVVEGDLSQSIGAAVERGEELFKIAPLDSYRVILEVDESDIGNIEIGQTGVLRVAALPQDPMTYRIEQITAISEQKEGRNFFRVEASLDKVTGRLRPGMEGIAKTSVDTRLLIGSYTQKMINWIYLATWRWTP
jgi:RND family efflux transporter MFP subunit